jgi:hypothetical protein
MAYLLRGEFFGMASIDIAADGEECPPVPVSR